MSQINWTKLRQLATSRNWARLLLLLTVAYIAQNIAGEALTLDWGAVHWQELRADPNSAMVLVILVEICLPITVWTVVGWMFDALPWYKARE